MRSHERTEGLEMLCFFLVVVVVVEKCASCNALHVPERSTQSQSFQGDQYALV